MINLRLNTIHAIFTIILSLFCFSYSCAEISPAVQPKAYMLAVGINDHSSFPPINTCESDAAKFVGRIKTDGSFTELQAALLLGKQATKDGIREVLISISKSAAPEDVFIFYDASLAAGGSILLSDSSTITPAEIYTWSQSILTARQLFYLDIRDGDEFIGQLKNHFQQNPDVSALCKQNRVILYAASPAFISEGNEGGLLTNLYIKNSTLKISDIFSDPSRTRTELFSEIVSRGTNKGLDDLGAVETEGFSEKEYQENILRGTEVISDQTKSLGNDSVINKGETLCLIIGIKDYDFIRPPLKNTLNDARALRSILSTNYKTKTIPLENPTYDEFMLKLVEIQNKYKFEDGSQFLFFAAAHGCKDELGFGCLLLRDSKQEISLLKNAMRLIILKRFIGQLNCTNSLILLDICHSGTMLDDENCVKPSALEIPMTSRIYNEKLSPRSVAYKNFLNQKTKIFISSSNDQEAADGAGTNSPFAAVVLDFLKKNTLPVIDSYYLQKAIEQNIMTAEAISIPQFCMYGGCKDDGRFLFFRK